MKRALARWSPWIKLLVAGGLLVFVFATGQINLDVLRGALERWHWLALGVLGVVPVFTFGICRWWVLLRSQGIRIGLWETVQIAFIGYFFNTVMPGSVGGDLIKAYYVARDRKGQRVEAVSTIALDRLIGLFALLGIGAIAAVAFPSVGFGQPGLAMLSWFVLICLAAGAALAILFLGLDLRTIGLLPKEKAGPILGALGRLYDAFRLYREKKRTLALALLLSLCAHSFGVTLNVALAKSLGEEEMTAPQYLYVIPLGLVVNGIPVAPGGWGVGEYGYGKLFEAATGDEENVGSELALLFHLAFTFWNLVGFFFYIGHRRQVEEARRMAEGEEG